MWKGNWEREKTGRDNCVGNGKMWLSFIFQFPFLFKNNQKNKLVSLNIVVNIFRALTIGELYLK